MAEHPWNRASTAWRKERLPPRGSGPRLDASAASIALIRAWILATIGTAVLIVALAIAPFWDGAIFMHALRDALSRDAQLMQSFDEPAAGPEQPREISARR